MKKNIQLLGRENVSIEHRDQLVEQFKVFISLSGFKAFQDDCPFFAYKIDENYFHILNFLPSMAMDIKEKFHINDELLVKLKLEDRIRVETKVELINRTSRIDVNVFNIPCDFWAIPIANQSGFLNHHPGRANFPEVPSLFDFFKGYGDGSKNIIDYFLEELKKISVEDLNKARSTDGVSILKDFIQNLQKKYSSFSYGFPYKKIA